MSDPPRPDRAGREGAQVVATREADEVALRAAWRTLVEQRLPAASPARDWPIALDHCFARVLLDNAVGAPWRSRIAPPAWRNTPADTLAQAIALGEKVLAGSADLAALNAHSLALRGKRGPPRKTGAGNG